MVMRVYTERTNVQLITLGANTDQHTVMLYNEKICTLVPQFLFFLVAVTTFYFKL